MLQRLLDAHWIKVVSMWILLIGKVCPYNCLQRKWHAVVRKHILFLWLQKIEKKAISKEICLSATKNLADSLHSFSPFGKTCLKPTTNGSGRYRSQQDKSQVFSSQESPFPSKVFTWNFFAIFTSILKLFSSRVYIHLISIISRGNAIL